MMQSLFFLQEMQSAIRSCQHHPQTLFIMKKNKTKHRVASTEPPECFSPPEIPSHTLATTEASLFLTQLMQVKEYWRSFYVFRASQTCTGLIAFLSVKSPVFCMCQEIIHHFESTPNSCGVFNLTTLTQLLHTVCPKLSSRRGIVWM